jgi:hypothetical protein
MSVNMTCRNHSFDWGFFAYPLTDILVAPNWNFEVRSMFSALKSATIQTNIRFKTKIDEVTLVSILLGQSDPAPWVAHLHSLFTEIPDQHLLRLLNEQGISFSDLESLCHCMPKTYAQSCAAKIHDLAKTA